MQKFHWPSIFSHRNKWTYLLKDPFWSFLFHLLLILPLFCIKRLGILRDLNPTRPFPGQNRLSSESISPCRFIQKSSLMIYDSIICDIWCLLCYHSSYHNNLIRSPKKDNPSIELLTSSLTSPSLSIWWKYFTSQIYSKIFAIMIYDFIICDIWCVRCYVIILRIVII